MKFKSYKKNSKVQKYNISQKQNCFDNLYSLLIRADKFHFKLLSLYLSNTHKTVLKYIKIPYGVSFRVLINI